MQPSLHPHTWPHLTLRPNPCSHPYIHKPDHTSLCAQSMQPSIHPHTWPHLTLRPPMQPSIHPHTWPHLTLRPNSCSHQYIHTPDHTSLCAPIMYTNYHDIHPYPSTHLIIYLVYQFIILSYHCDESISHDASPSCNPTGMQLYKIVCQYTSQLHHSCGKNKGIRYDICDQTFIQGQSSWPDKT